MKIFLSNKKIKFLLSSVFFYLIIVISLLLFFGTVKKHVVVSKTISSAFSNSKIRKALLSINSKAIINSIFINISPDNKKTIYVGGSNLRIYPGSVISGALVSSNDDGKTWRLDNYFINPVNASISSTPVINKIMTDFYTTDKGTSDSIVISGKYLRSIPRENNGPSPANSGNGNSTNAGQIAYKSIYYANKNTKANMVYVRSWNDLADKDFDSSTNAPNILGGSQKINSISTIKMYSTDNLQDHIYIITNDENSGSYVSHTKNNIVNELSIFNTYDFFINNEQEEPIITEVKLTGLSKYLNPQSIYTKINRNTIYKHKNFVDNNIQFDADKTSFVFMSGITRLVHSNAWNWYNNKCYIVENQHFDAISLSYPQQSDLTSFDNPIFIQYTATPTPTTEYLGLDKTLKNKPLFDNFLIKSITINPISTFDDDRYDSNFLVLGGEKNNKSYMIEPQLVQSSITPDNMITPIVPPNSTTNADKSFISHIINLPRTDGKDIPGNISSVTAIAPFVLFGKNMNSSNDNIALPDSGYDFQPNKQGFKGQGLLLANIRLKTTVNTKKATMTQTSSVIYSLSRQYSTKGKTETSKVNFVDNSDNYSMKWFASLSKNYTFTSSDFQQADNIFSKQGDIVTFKIDKNQDGNYHFITSNPPNNYKKKFNMIIHVVVPISVVFFTFSLLLLFMTKDILFVESRKKIKK